MHNLKLAIIAGASGFGLSLLVALVSGVRLPMLLIRPLIFGAVFFALGAGVIYLYRRFLDIVPGQYEDRGQNVDISVDDSEMMIDEDGTAMDFTGFADVGMPHESDDFHEEGIDAPSTFRQNGRGLEQNSTLGYTEDKQGSREPFKSMGFDVVDEGGETFQSIPSAGGRKVYAKVPEMDKVINTDPKKLASTVQNLLSDE
jgi:hypothetical protein